MSGPAGALRLLPLGARLPVGDFQKRDVERGENEQKQGYDADAGKVLKMAEHHRHQGTADMGRGHLQADDGGAAPPAEIGGRHVLNGGINGPRARTDEDKPGRCGEMPLERQGNQQDAEKLDGDADADERFIAEPTP